MFRNKGRGGGLEKPCSGSRNIRNGVLDPRDISAPIGPRLSGPLRSDTLLRGVKLGPRGQQKGTAVPICAPSELVLRIATGGSSRAETTQQIL